MKEVALCNKKQNSTKVSHVYINITNDCINIHNNEVPCTGYMWSECSMSEGVTAWPGGGPPVQRLSDDDLCLPSDTA